jgi:dimethylargininase
MGGKAFTRAVSPMLGDCALTHLDRSPIDGDKARTQHAAYESALRAAGVEVIRLPELPGHPDGVFVEDTALLLGSHAIITRPGAPSRAGEVHSTLDGLARHFEIRRLLSGHVDGGDVLRIGRSLYVGLSSRTDLAGVAELERLASPLGFTVVPVELRGCLHLKTAATLVGADSAGKTVLVYNREAVDPCQFASVDAIATGDGEPDAANVVSVGGRVIIAAGCPKTAASLQQRGFEVVEVDVSELQKAEAGVTCMSLLSETPHLS